MDLSYYELKYGEYAKEIVEGSPKIKIPPQKDLEIKNKVREIVKTKAKEIEYIRDPKSIIKRWYTGWGGECALEIYLSESFVDFSVGHSLRYSVCDLSKIGLQVGVKSIEIGHFPLLKKPSASSPRHNPQIILAKETNTSFYMCGLATEEVVNNPKNFKDSLVKSKDVRNKSAFFRFDLLKTFKSLRELKELLA